MARLVLRDAVISCHLGGSGAVKSWIVLARQLARVGLHPGIVLGRAL